MKRDTDLQLNLTNKECDLLIETCEKVEEVHDKAKTYEKKLNKMVNFEKKTEIIEKHNINIQEQASDELIVNKSSLNFSNMNDTKKEMINSSLKNDINQINKNESPGKENTQNQPEMSFQNRLSAIHEKYASSNNNNVRDLLKKINPQDSKPSSDGSIKIGSEPIQKQKFFKEYFNQKFNKDQLLEIKDYQNFKENNSLFWTHRNLDDIENAIKNTMAGKDVQVDMQTELQNFNKEVNKSFKLIRNFLKKIDGNILNIYEYLDDYVKGAFRQMNTVKSKIKEKKWKAAMGSDRQEAFKLWGNMKRDTTVNDQQIYDLMFKKEYKNWDTNLTKGTKFIKLLDETNDFNLVSKKFYPIFHKEDEGFDKQHYCGYRPNSTDIYNKKRKKSQGNLSESYDNSYEEIEEHDLSEDIHKIKKRHQTEAQEHFSKTNFTTYSRPFRNINDVDSISFNKYDSKTNVKIKKSKKKKAKEYERHSTNRSLMAEGKSLSRKKTGNKGSNYHTNSPQKSLRKHYEKIQNEWLENSRQFYTIQDKEYNNLLSKTYSTHMREQNLEPYEKSESFKKYKILNEILDPRVKENISKHLINKNKKRQKTENTNEFMNNAQINGTQIGNKSVDKETMMKKKYQKEKLNIAPSANFDSFQEREELNFMINRSKKVPTGRKDLSLMIEGENNFPSTSKCQYEEGRTTNRKKKPEKQQSESAEALKEVLDKYNKAQNSSRINESTNIKNSSNFNNVNLNISVHVGNKVNYNINSHPNDSKSIYHPNGNDSKRELGDRTNINVSSIHKENFKNIINNSRFTKKNDKTNYKNMQDAERRINTEVNPNINSGRITRKSTDRQSQNQNKARGSLNLHIPNKSSLFDHQIFPKIGGQVQGFHNNSVDQDRFNYINEESIYLQADHSKVARSKELRNDQTNKKMNNSTIHEKTKQNELSMRNAINLEVFKSNRKKYNDVQSDRSNTIVSQVKKVLFNQNNNKYGDIKVTGNSKHHK